MMKKATITVLISLLGIPSIFAQTDTFNLAKFQSIIADSAISDSPVQFATDGVTAPMIMQIRSPDLTVTYQRRDPSVTGIDIYAAWTDSLINPVWHTDGMDEMSQGWANDVETVEVTVPMEGTTNRFIRIEVSR